jgi:hypothetical protein
VPPVHQLLGRTHPKDKCHDAQKSQDQDDDPSNGTGIKACIEGDNKVKARKKSWMINMNINIL